MDIDSGVDVRGMRIGGSGGAAAAGEKGVSLAMARAGCLPHGCEGREHTVAAMGTGAAALAATRAGP